MLTRLFKIFSQWVSWLAVVLDTSHNLFPGRFAYKHELNTIEITAFDGNHLLIGEGEYGQVYAVKPTEKSPELGNMIKLGTTRYGKSSAELNAVSPDLAQTFLGAKYKPGKDYEKNEFRVDSWETVSARLYAFLTADMVRNFAGSDFTAHDLYFADKPVFVFISFHESDLLSMAPLIKFVCESLMMELLTLQRHLAGM